MLRPDQLGKKGEGRFIEICAEADITCNRAVDDTAGWDFLLNFPARGDNKTPLDIRRPGINCYVQVKTVFAPTKPAKLSLHMAERIAKYPAPSFICLLVVDQLQNYVDSYLIHLVGERLASVLQRLRQAERDKKHKKLNRLSITFAPEESERFVLSGAGLVERIQTLVGPDVDKYIANKQRERETLGYDKKPYQMSVSFDTNDIDALFDIFAGRTTEAPVHIREMFESRFKIPLPFGEPGRGTLTIQPSSVGECRIRYLERSRSIPSVFDGKVTYVRIGAITRLYLSFQAFTCIFEQGRRGTTMRFDEHSLNTLVNVDEYLSTMKLFAGLADQRGVLEVDLQDGRQNIRISFADMDVNGITIHSSRYSGVSIDLWQALKNIMAFAGAGAIVKFAIADVVAMKRHIEFFQDLLQDANCQITFIKEEGPGMTLTTGDNILPISFLIGNTLVACYCSLNIEVDPTTEPPWPTFSKPQLEEIRFLEASAESQQKFISNAQSRKGIDTVLYIPGALAFPTPDSITSKD